MPKTAAHVVRRRGRRDANGAFGLGTTTPNYAWDFVNNKARFNNINYGALANTPGWSFTRASTGYAQTSAGALTSFASGELRRTDKGVLIEGARTNLCLQSQTFDNASWTKSRATVTADAAVAPDGTTTADKLVEDSSATTTHRTQQGVTKAASAIQYTASVYVKAAERTFAQLTLTDATEDDGAQVFINLSDGTLSTPAARVGAGGGFTSISATTATLANGWYRVSLTATTDSDTTVRLWVHTATSLSNNSYTGDGTSGIYLWGAQLEAASFPSSYIPTTTASATRAADVLTVPVSGLDYPLSLFAETDLVTLAGGSVSQSYFEIDDSSGNNRALLYGTNGGSQASRMYCATANVNQALPTVGALTTGVRKTAGRCSLNSFQVAGNGTLATEDTSGTVPATPNRLVFGKESGTGTELFGYLRRAAIFSRALTDAELQSVTT